MWTALAVTMRCKAGNTAAADGTSYSHDGRVKAIVLSLGLSVIGRRPKGGAKCVALSGGQGGLSHHPQHKAHLVCTQNDRYL